MRTTLFAIALMALSVSLNADEPAIKFGATIFADFTRQSPEMSSFNVARAYINVTGSLNKRLSFRLTPDVARELGGGSSLNGSQQFRMKYAYGQLHLDEWISPGSFVRFGMQQTPYIDSVEPIYRYRFQGTVFAEREGYLASSDTGVTMRYVLPHGYGDLHGGFYNGEGYNKAEANGEKAFQIRASVRPLPKSALGKGLRATVFYVGDHYAESAGRERLIGQLTYEHKHFNAGIESLSTKDRPSEGKPQLDGQGWSVFATPRLGKGWELLLRHDHNQPDSNSDVVRERNITGVAYWLPNLQKVTAAVMVDRDSLSVTGKDDDTRYAVRMLLSF